MINLDDFDLFDGGTGPYGGYQRTDAEIEPAATWAEIGAELGISRQGAHQLGLRAMRKCAKWILAHPRQDYRD
jgi:hypothetical protein